MRFNGIKRADDLDDPDTPFGKYLKRDLESRRKSATTFKDLPDLSGHWYDAYGDWRTYVDALNRGVHYPVSALKAIKSGFVPIVRLGARSFSLYGALPKVDESIQRAVTSADKFIDKYVFDKYVLDVLDRNMHNKGVTKLTKYPERATDLLAQLWSFGALGKALGIGGKATQAGTSRWARLNDLIGRGFLNSFQFQHGPRSLNSMATNIRKRNFGAAAWDGIEGAALIAAPWLGRIGLKGQLALAAKHPNLAKALGIPLSVIRHPLESLLGISLGRYGYDRYKQSRYFDDENKRYQELADRVRRAAARVYGSVRKNQNLMLGLGAAGLGLYGIDKALYGKKRKKTEDEEGETTDATADNK